MSIIDENKLDELGIGKEKTVEEETYEVDMECCNCGQGMTVEIIKGVWVGESEDICPNCECELGDCCVIASE